MLTGACSGDGGDAGMDAESDPDPVPPETDNPPTETTDDPPTEDVVDPLEEEFGPALDVIEAEIASEAFEDPAPSYDLPAGPMQVQTVLDYVEAQSGVTPIEDQDTYRAELPDAFPQAFGLSGPFDDIALGTSDVDVFNDDDDDRDLVFGFEGDDDIELGDGNDAYGGLLERDLAGNDNVFGEAGNDFLFDAVGTDRLYGDEGNDTITAVDLSEVNEPDVLDGGDNNDLLRGDNGDTMTGGTGSDDFEVFVPMGTVDPVIITDFSLGDEEFVNVYVETDTPQFDEDYSVTINDDGTDSTILVDGQPVAVLQGITGVEALSDVVTVGNYQRAGGFPVVAT